MPSDMTFRTSFGSWGNALREAGFEPVKWIPTKNGVTRRGTRNKERKKVDSFGYDTIFEPTHPIASKNGYVRVHRKVMYDAGLLTNPTMEVHHKNGDKKDNRVENLEVLEKAAHARISTPLGSKKPRRNSRPCRFCSTLTGSKYGLCRRHYKAEWSRGNIHENPDLLKGQHAK